ncbi:MAG: acetolactate synthase small subunit [Bdellovibrionales bacterium]|nr:acetolactate synthase small subunit [Bdellovibrionales bacterium]
MERIYTLSAFTENHPGVLHRLTSVLTRRKLNIESLTVSETETKGISRFTIVIRTSPELMKKVTKAIDRTIEVVEVYASENHELLFKEIAFYRVRTEDRSKRPTIEEHAHRYGGVVTYADDNSLVIEKTGSEDDVDSLYRLLEPFGILEFVRSGRIAIRKQARDHCELFGDTEE